MLIHEALEKMKFDKRVIEYNISIGLIKQKDYDDFLKTLPDDTNNSVTMNIFSEGAEEDLDNESLG